MGMTLILLCGASGPVPFELVFRRSWNHGSCRAAILCCTLSRTEVTTVYTVSYPIIFSRVRVDIRDQAR